MDINKIIDKLDDKILRQILKDECENNYALANRIKIINNDKSFIDNKELSKEIRRIDSLLADITYFDYHNYNSFDIAVSELSDICLELVNNFNGDYEYAIKVITYILDGISYSFEYYDDGLECLVDNALYVIDYFYSITKDMRLIKSLIDAMDADGFLHIEAELLLKYVDNANAKEILDYIMNIACDIDSDALDEILKLDFTDYEKMKAYNALLNEGNFVKLLGILCKNHMYKEFDSIYLKNKNKYEQYIMVDSWMIEYTRILFNRYNGNDNQRALDILRKSISINFNEEFYLDSIKISNKEVEEGYYKKLSNKIAICEIYLFEGRLDDLMNLVKSINNKYFYDRYLNALGKKYTDEYFSYYSRRVLSLLKYARNRQEYRALAEDAEVLLKINAPKEKNIAICNSILESYSKKRALLEEFEYFFDRVYK